MKILGIIGGIGSESTIDYYRLLTELYRARRQDGAYPPLIINSIDLKRMVDLITRNALAEVTDCLVAEVRRLEDAGADLGLLAANTPHIVFEDVQRRSSLPLLSIVLSTCRAAQVLNLRKVGLFGTRFTMQGRFYPDVFSREGIELVVPNADDQAYIHDKYMTTRRGLLDIADRLKEATGIEGVILAGTELPLLLRDVADRGMPFLDTTRIHVEEAVSAMLS